MLGHNAYLTPRDRLSVSDRITRNPPFIMKTFCKYGSPMETIVRLRSHTLLLLLLSLQLSGCSTWQPRTVSPQAVIEMEQPSRVRVTTQARVVEEASPNLDRVALRDESELVLSNPTVANGMIVGTTDAGPVARVVLGDVLSIEVQESDAVRTGVLAGGVALVSTLFVLLLSTLSGG